MPGSQTTPGPTGARNNAPADFAFRQVNNVGNRVDNGFAAQWLAYTLPYRRFADVLADACARIGGDVGCYSFIAVDFHHILLASLPAHSLALRPAGLLSRLKRPLSRGSSPAGYPSEPLVSYQINRQLSGWILPPLVIRAFGAHRRASHRPAASAERYDRVPGVRATNGEMRRKPLCQPGMVAASERKPGQNAASTGGEQSPGRQRQRREPGKPTWRCLNRLSLSSAWLAPLSRGSLNSAHIHGTDVPVRRRGCQATYAERAVALCRPTQVQ